VVSAVGSACGSSKEDPDFEKVSWEKLCMSWSGFSAWLWLLIVAPYTQFLYLRGCCISDLPLYLNCRLNCRRRDRNVLLDRLLNHKKKIKQSIESSESSCLISFCAFEMVRFLSTLICVTATTLLQVAAHYLRMMEIKCISFMLFKPCMFPKQ
jgi:hypothetical protein